MHPAMDKRVFYKEARTLVEAGYDVVHLAPDHDRGQNHEWEQDKVRIVNYVPFRGLMGRLKGLLKLYRMAKSLDAQVYHCNEVDSWVVGVMMRILNGRLCVFDVHEHYAEEFAEKRILSWARPLVRWGVASLMRLLSKFTDRVVVAKTSLLADFNHMPEGHVVAVRNFATVSLLPIPESRPRLEGRLKMVHLGLFNRYRGWPQLLQGMKQAQCQDTELLVIGTINDGSEEEFKRTILELGLEERVEYQTWLPFDQAMNRVKKADVGVICFQPGLFNHVHALPHKMFDYMGAELAVIAPNIAVEVREIVEDAKAGVLIDMANPDAIARVIDRFCADRQLVRDFGIKGRQAVLDRYNWETEAKTLVKLYRGLERA
ncbi:glycosyltransferase [Alphaproteobacteria bacterium]|nr:glycosyltransferase [Alphaproteobacteria bacterium]